jgi:hypothetical protein
MFLGGSGGSGHGINSHTSLALSPIYRMPARRSDDVGWVEMVGWEVHSYGLVFEH